MNLKGNHQFHASSKAIWDCLMNPEVLARITPGISRLEQTEEDQYKAIADVKIGPVKGSFEGDLKVAEKKEPQSFVLKITQKSKIGNVSADVAIALKEKKMGRPKWSLMAKQNFLACSQEQGKEYFLA